MTDCTIDAITANVLQIIKKKEKSVESCLDLLKYLKILCEAKSKFIRGNRDICEYFRKHNRSSIRYYNGEPDFRQNNDIAKHILELYNNEHGYLFGLFTIVHYFENDYFFEQFFATNNLITNNILRLLNTTTHIKVISKICDLHDCTFMIDQSHANQYIGESTHGNYSAYASPEIMERLLRLKGFVLTDQMMYDASKYATCGMLKVLVSFGGRMNVEHLELVIDSYKKSNDRTEICDKKIEYIINGGVMPNSHIFEQFIGTFELFKKKRKSCFYQYDRLEQLILKKGYVPTYEDVIYALTKRIYIKNLKNYNPDLKDAYKNIESIDGIKIRLPRSITK
jgi:hypothetical protein